MLLNNEINVMIEGLEMMEAHTLIALAFNKALTYKYGT